MKPSPHFIDKLLLPDMGRIVACNLLSGLSLRLYSRDFLVSALVWWERFADFKGYTHANEIVGAIVTLPELSAGRYPSGFSPPAIAFPNPYIIARRARRFNPKAWLASAREAQTLVKCGHPADIVDLASAGVVLTARPGTRAYARGVENSWKGAAPRLRLAPGPGKSLTNPLDDFAVLWFTPAATLQDLLRSTGGDQKADAARDVLGLVHCDRKNTLAVVFFRAALAEARPDRGRPTVLDARQHSRFKCRKVNEALRPRWGSAANLDRVTTAGSGDVTGHDERVCGRVPARPTVAGREPVLHVRFVGAPKVPRNDFFGVGDNKFADLLEKEAVAASGGRSVRDQLLAL